jgi:hypothetical protein
MSQEFIIYADESTQKGNYYSNFYGGALARSADIDNVRRILREAKQERNLFNEIKWSKVSAQYLDKYIGVMDQFFALVQQDLIKVRIMFTQNAHVPVGLDAYQRENSYHLLYYQFIKHAFGLSYANAGQEPIHLRIYLDKMPDTREKNAQFKAYLRGLQDAAHFRQARINIREDQIAEVDSHQHDLLQCLDVVLGAMQFRLNDQHKVKPPESARRGKKTIAKEKLYKHIHKQICQMHPHFNIGVSTGTKGDRTNRWRHSYRHWLFIPGEYRHDGSQTKGKQKAP